MFIENALDKKITESVNKNNFISKINKFSKFQDSSENQ
jgi:hypothetical protein